MDIGTGMGEGYNSINFIFYAAKFFMQQNQPGRINAEGMIIYELEEKQ